MISDIISDGQHHQGSARLGYSSKLGFSSAILIYYYDFGKLFLFIQNGTTSQNDMVMASILDFNFYRQMEKGA